jgi:hypothetical protein
MESALVYVKISHISIRLLLLVLIPYALLLYFSAGMDFFIPKREGSVAEIIAQLATIREAACAARAQRRASFRSSTPNEERQSSNLSRSPSRETATPRRSFLASVGRHSFVSSDQTSI